MAARIHVVAGALFDSAGRVLIAQRPPGKHMAGGWEFPGGKLDPGEDPFSGLKRELEEELGVNVQEAERLIAYEHSYPEKTVYLDLWWVKRYEGEPTSVEGQALQWVKVGELERVGLLEADRAMIASLRMVAR